MQTITTIGLDIAKSVFQVHGVDADAKVLQTQDTGWRGANGRTRGLVLCRCPLVGRPRERALTRSLRDLNPVREMGRGRSGVSRGV